MPKILMVATALATTNLARGWIVHTNPDPKADPRSRFIWARDETDVARLEKAEVARRGSKEDLAEARKALEQDPEIDVDAASASRAANVADADSEEREASGLDTRATLHKQAGGEDIDKPSGGEEVSDDVDAAPASGGRKTRAPAAEKAE